MSAEAPGPRRRGPATRPPKVLISLRLDPDTVARYRATGRGWQSRIAADLREAAPRPKAKRRGPATP